MFSVLGTPGFEAVLQLGPHEGRIDIICFLLVGTEKATTSSFDIVRFQCDAESFLLFLSENAFNMWYISCFFTDLPLELPL